MLQAVRLAFMRCLCKNVLTEDFQCLSQTFLCWPSKGCINRFELTLCIVRPHLV